VDVWIFILDLDFRPSYDGPSMTTRTETALVMKMRMPLMRAMRIGGTVVSDS
jgi:hypothetical protein